MHLQQNAQADSAPVGQWEYNEDIRRRCGAADVPPPPAWLFALVQAIQASGRILAAPTTFRDEPTATEAALYEQAAAACGELLREHRCRKAPKLLAGPK